MRQRDDIELGSNSFPAHLRLRARMLCEKLLTFASPLGLYAEEIDARTSRHLGNFPQAFSHLALIDAVLRIIDAEKAHAAGVLEAVARENGT